MNQSKFFISMMMLYSLTCYAEKPEISFKPLTPVAFTLSTNQVAIVNYSIKNETGATIKVNTVLIEGMKSLKGDGLCGVGIVLLSKKGCMLSLELTGSQMKGDIKHMPFLCVPNFSKCHFPKYEDQMDIILKR